jgi:hypothetical protein
MIKSSPPPPLSVVADGEKNAPRMNSFCVPPVAAPVTDRTLVDPPAVKAISSICGAVPSDGPFKSV